MIESIESYPIEFSAKGNNTHYVPCEFRARSQNYAICLNVIKAYNEGRRKGDDVCCSEIKREVCPAFLMQRQEIEAGHTLYYVPRVQVEVAPVVARSYITPESVKRTDSYKRGWDSAGGTINDKSNSACKNTAKRIATKPSSVERTVEKKPVVYDGGLGSVVSEMAREHQAKSSDIKAESVLEKARRIRESRGQTSE